MSFLLPDLGGAAWGPVNNEALTDLDDRVTDLEVAGRPTWLNGAGVPSTSLGHTGDYYLNKTNGDWYQKTDDVTWAARGNITGPTGPQGLPGVGSAAWQGPGHAYTVGSTVQHTDGSWLTCITGHTSGASIDLSKFETVATHAGTVQQVALSATYATKAELAAADLSPVDNGDGTFTVTSTTGVVDNGDGTYTIGAA